MTPHGHPLLPDWPEVRPTWGGVSLRRFEDGGSAMVRDLASDPYVPLIGTLPAHCGDEDAIAYIARQRQRHADGTGFSFAIADARTDRALGSMGLWLRDYPLGRAQAGYAVAPSARGRQSTAFRDADGDEGGPVDVGPLMHGDQGGRRRGREPAGRPHPARARSVEYFPRRPA